jgi:hypothetical protein
VVGQEEVVHQEEGGSATLLNDVVVVVGVGVVVVEQTLLEYEAVADVCVVVMVGFPKQPYVKY